MKVSVIIITYNRADLLKDTLDAILNQTFKEFEVIIVDNYSTDNTDELIKNYNNFPIKYFKNNNDGILAVNRNFAIKKAKGEYIAICDDDDIWAPQKLEKQLKEFESNNSIGLVCTNAFYFYENGTLIKLHKSKDKYITFNELLSSNTIVNSSVLLKKSILNDVGLLDEDRDILGGDDYELWLRIAKKYKIKFIGIPLVKYRIHARALQNIYAEGTKDIELLKREKCIMKKLSDKKIINNELYEQITKRFNYQHLLIKFVNNNNIIDLDMIVRTKMAIKNKCKLLILYFLFRLGIQSPLQRIRMKLLTTYIKK